ncbi:MAG: hypothetical protein HYS60_00145 [Candidatus Wildermuthbacteria bacterium]|nr:hypothetical protein [Candidatus Wildermuthbacteria bacterium]
MFLIPIVIIIGIVAFSFAGDIVKDLHLSFSDAFTLSSSKTTEEKTAQPSATVKKQTTTSQTPRAPPATSQTQPTQQPSASANSPYFQKIEITNVRATQGNQPALITLRSNSSDEGKISITGWRIKSTWSGEFRIPLGISSYHPGLNSEPAEQILLDRYETAYLKGEANPIGRGKNFKTNECFGYLKTFYPNIPGYYSCYQDKPKVEDIKNLTPSCQEYILKEINFGSCQPPNYSNDPIAANAECVAYINNYPGGFNYQGCYQKHSKDSDFLSSDWHIYMDTTFGNSLHDSIILYDSSGLIVDTYTY